MRPARRFAEGEWVYEQPSEGSVYPVHHVASYPLPDGLDEGTKVLLKVRDGGNVTCEDEQGRIWQLNFIQLTTRKKFMRGGEWVYE